MSNAQRITPLPATAEGSAGIIGSMTERGAPSADTSPACPFVAFEDERDERADRPDHRHRCYAEAEPAPRALAHQEAYCLSSAFPVCPTFQEWARREAAHTRAGGAATPTPTAATVTSSDSDADADDGGASSRDDADRDDTDDDDSWEQRRDDRPVEERPRRNPPRDWAAPPPWAAGAAGLAGAAGGAGAAGAAGAGSGGAGSGRSSDGSGRPDFLGAPPDEGRGLVGSAADRLARGGHIADDPAPADLPRIRHSEHPSTPADPELAGLVGARGGRNDPPPIARSGRQPTVSSTRDRDRDRERERERERAAQRSGHDDGPAWEGPRRYEAYPQIKARASMPGMPGIPRIALLAGALAIAALALFFLPALLGIGGGNDAAATPSPTALATATPEPTPIPAPTPQVYTIKAGDTLSKIAKAFGVTVDDLLAANKDTIKNKDRIVVGNQITIPVPASDEVGGEASGSPAP